jgi:hypothetical protein
MLERSLLTNSPPAVARTLPLRGFHLSSSPSGTPILADLGQCFGEGTQLEF